MAPSSSLPRCPSLWDQVLVASSSKCDPPSLSTECEDSVQFVGL
jgi:hypothetical protein